MFTVKQTACVGYTVCLANEAIGLVFLAVNRRYMYSQVKAKPVRVRAASAGTLPNRLAYLFFMLT